MRGSPLGPALLKEAAKAAGKAIDRRREGNETNQSPP
eukprot:gene7797-8493_t